MRPIGDFRSLIKSMRKDAFVVAHPHPVLLYAVKHGALLHSEVSGRTIERIAGLSSLDRSVDDGNESQGPEGAYLVYELAPDGADGGEVLIGRGDQCGVVIPDASVSRRHASIRGLPLRPAICDLDSTLGTRVNGVLVEPHAPLLLAAADRVTLGEVELYFLPAKSLFDFVRRHFDEESRRNPPAPG